MHTVSFLFANANLPPEYCYFCSAPVIVDRCFSCCCVCGPKFIGLVPWGTGLVEATKLYWQKTSYLIFEMIFLLYICWLKNFLKHFSTFKIFSLCHLTSMFLSCYYLLLLHYLYCAFFLLWIFLIFFLYL